MSLTIRAETTADQADIFAIHQAAFPTDAEARLVDALRAQSGLHISLIAENAQNIVGHIAFSPMTPECDTPSSGDQPAKTLTAMGLAPLAVAPAHQKQGIGGALIKAGIEACKEREVDAIFVLGAPAYYGKFGFVPASGYGLRCEYDVPPEAFMVQELHPGTLASWQGTILYHRAFQSLE